MNRLLDPRTFPVSRIAELVHALPAPGVEIDVANVLDAARAADWLNAHGRPARLVPAPENAPPTQLWSPSPGLHHAFAMTPGRALDLGCGTGRDAVALAMAGWDVTGVDILPDALDRARTLAELHGVHLQLKTLDVSRTPLGAETYDLVCAFRFLPSLEIMASLLAPGGMLLVETFTDRERARTGKPKDATLVLPASGPPSLPPNIKVSVYEVAEIDGREFATLVAIKTEGDVNGA